MRRQGPRRRILICKEKTPVLRHPFLACAPLTTVLSPAVKALAHPSRLAIVDRLSTGEASAGVLAQIAGCAPSTMSKHLSILKTHGIVDDRREGTVVWYSLLTPCVMSFFSCTRAVLQERA
jgi:ArsR family transcriptional regulator